MLGLHYSTESSSKQKNKTYCVAAGYWFIRGLTSWLKVGFHKLLTSKDLFMQLLRGLSGEVWENPNRQNVTVIPAKHADGAFVLGGSLTTAPSPAAAAVSCWGRLQQELLIVLQWEAGRGLRYNISDFLTSTRSGFTHTNNRAAVPLHQWLSYSEKWKPCLLQTHRTRTWHTVFRCSLRAIHTSY